MKTSRTVSKVRARALAALAKLQWLAPLFARVTLGVLFVSTGWGKLHQLDKVTEFFTQLHIPYAAFNATLVSWTELICGALLLIGLASRFAAIPLIITMTVALLTAKRGELNGLPALFGMVEFTYIALLVVVAIVGPGAFSIDTWIADRLQRSRRGEREAREIPVGRLSHGT
jgi:putative oxidoreductase